MPNNCIRPDGQCDGCPAFFEGECTQDDNAGGTGHGDISMTDAEGNL